MMLSVSGGYSIRLNSMFRRRRRRTYVKRVPPKHYTDHKELARGIILERLIEWNGHYDLSYKRVSIRNQKTCWGSCSEYGNLNFNYKIIFLPESLMDYIIVHELCHLTHLNHSKDFWSLVSEQIPDYKARRDHLRRMTHIPAQGFPSSVVMNVRAELEKASPVE